MLTPNGSDAPDDAADAGTLSLEGSDDADDAVATGTLSLEGSDDAADAGTLSPDGVECVLADFRVWLSDLYNLPDPEPTDVPPIDLHQLVGQFTALRHEVNLQTKAARAAIEQTGTAVEHLGSAVVTLREGAEDAVAVKPLMKAVADIYDNLALALRQAVRQREAIEKPLAEVADAVVDDLPNVAALDPSLVGPRTIGFWGRLFGVPQAPGIPADERLKVRNWHEGLVHEASARKQRVTAAAAQVRSSFDGLIAGYQMSLNRVGRAIEQSGLEAIPCVGGAFDPELMEVVDTVAGSDVPAGTVLEEVRRGYRRGDVVFRYAQVKVAQ